MYHPPNHPHPVLSHRQNLSSLHRRAGQPDGGGKWKGKEDKTEQNRCAVFVVASLLSQYGRVVYVSHLPRTFVPTYHFPLSTLHKLLPQLRHRVSRHIVTESSNVCSYTYDGKCWVRWLQAEVSKASSHSPHDAHLGLHRHYHTDAGNPSKI